MRYIDCSKSIVTMHRIGARALSRVGSQVEGTVMVRRANGISWTSDERSLLVTEAARLIRTGECNFKTPALTKAMETMLPVERRRRPAGLMTGVAAWFNPDLAAQLAATGTHMNEKADWATARKDGHRKVFWNQAERTTLAKLVAREMVEGRQPSHLKALIAVQNALPADRRRAVHTVADMPWLKPAVEEHKRALLVPRPPPKMQAIITPTPDVAPPAAAPLNGVNRANGFHHEPTPAQVAPPHEPAVAAQPTQEAQTLVHALHALRAPLVSLLAGIFRDALAQALHPPSEAPNAEPATTLHQASRTARPILPTVLVAGLKGAQKTIIEDEFRHLFNLRFYGADESKDQLRTLATQSKFAVAVTDFLSHSQTDIMRDRSPHYVPAGGGLSSLRQALANLAGAAH